MVYKIVKDSDLQTFQQKVLYLLQDGLELAGGVCYADGEYIQALFRRS